MGMRIAVFRALPGLGDMLCIVPALRALRAAEPGAQIVLVGLPSARWIVERWPYCDELVEFPGYPGLPEREPDARSVLSFLRSMQEREFDLALQFHGSGLVTNAVVALMGARANAGFVPAGIEAPAGAFLPWDPHEHEVTRYLRLLQRLGIPGTGATLEFPVHDDEARSAAHLVAAGGRPYVVLHPGTNQPARRWPAERFAAVADHLAALGYLPVFTGSARERALVAATTARVHATGVRDVSGRTSLGELAAIVRDARLVVCADTGVSHLAAAVGTPSVVVFRSSDVRRWAPLDAARHRRVGLDEPLVRARLGRPGDGRCLGDGCRHLALDELVPPAATGPDDVVREALSLLDGADRLSAGERG